MTIRGRFAPSPTGPLHLGNLQTALAAWLQVRLEGGEFVLRIEDLDRDRCQSRYVDSIVDDLRWLGLHWELGPGRGPRSDWLQGERDHHYRQALSTLAAAGHLFPCTCSRRELNDVASAPHGPLGTVYPGTCRGRVLAPGEDFAARPRDHALRLRVDGGWMTLKDMVRGPMRLGMADEVGDFVVLRRDGAFAYHLAVVVDDIAMGITDVLRGEDLAWSSFPQRLLYDRLGGSPPRYWHVPLRRDETGQRMAKRRGGETLARLRAAGQGPESVLGRLAFDLGLVDAPGPVSLGELLSGLDPASFAGRLRQGRDGMRPDRTGR